MADLMVIVIGLGAHYAIKDYIGFGFKVKQLNDDASFVPLKPWMVAGGKAELTGAEYEELTEDGWLSVKGKDKLAEILRHAGVVTLYDAANIALYEEQIGKPHDGALYDERLKRQSKAKIKS